MSADRWVVLVVAFALGVLVRDVAEDFRKPASAAPVSVMGTTTEYVCAHDMRRCM